MKCLRRFLHLTPRIDFVHCTVCAQVDGAGNERRGGAEHDAVRIKEFTALVQMVGKAEPTRIKNGGALWEKVWLK